MNPDDTQDISGLNRLTENAKSAVRRAFGLASEFAAAEVDEVLLLIAILESPNQLIRKMLDNVEVDLNATREQLKASISPGISLTEPKLGQGPKKLINEAFLLAEKLAHVYVGTEHLFLAFLSNPDFDFTREMQLAGLSYDMALSMMSNVGGYIPGLLSKTKMDGIDGFSNDELPYFVSDMNQQVVDGEFMPITGREEEIARLIHILARKTKNNPILVGDAGVGKTAVVQGFVQRLVAGHVPPSFVNTRVLTLDVAGIVAGARARGDIEERVIGFVNDVIDEGNAIVFIDEIHMIVGAGGMRDSMDIGNILKPYLTNPRLRVIGATTQMEYSRYFEEDPALSRRFQAIEVKELDQHSAIDILTNLKPTFEHYHGVKIKSDAITAAVELSSQFIPDRYLPDKAIDLLDEAAATVKIGREISIEPQLTDLGSKITKAQSAKQTAISAGEIEKAADFKAEEDQLTDKVAELMEGKDRTYSSKYRVVDAKLIEKVVVDWTKIPLAAGQQDRRKLRKIIDQIGSKIVGQDQAVKSVTAALQRAYMGLNSGKRPLSSFLFLGPTGVGKTELAKLIARHLFGDENLLIQMNMSEYMETHSIAKLIGAPPGYVGFQQGGQLTEEVRRKPYSVVLFDEIEKAHPDVLNLLLQILEEGELKDGRGRRAVFRNTVVVLTSNIGAEKVSRDRRLGFDVSSLELESLEADRAYNEMRGSLLESLRKQVRPEILNRLDEVIVFRGLNKEDCYAIAKEMLNQTQAALLEKRIILHFNDKVVEVINENGYSKEYGARNIRRTVQTMVENALAEYLNNQDIKLKKSNINVYIDVDEGKLKFTHQ